MLGIASHYKDYVQCQIREQQTWQPAPTYKGLKKGFCSTNNVEYEFWFCHDVIKRCVSATKKKYVLDWTTLPNTWPMKMGTNLSREGVLALEDVGFQLQQREALFPRRRLSTIPTLPILCSHFCMLSLQGNNGRIDKTCPNQDVINDKN